MKVHELKTWHKEFDAILSGDKRFEFRRDDRNFDRGDLLVLRRTTDDGKVTCGVILAWVTYIFRAPQLPDGYCIMSISVVEQGHCT